MPTEIIESNYNDEDTTGTKIIASNFNPETRFADAINQKSAAVSDILDLSDVYDYAGSKLGYISRYDTYNPNRDNEDFHAQNQGWMEKVGNTGKTFLTLGVNTFANAFLSPVRAVEATAAGDWDKLWNDDFGEDSGEVVRAQTNLNPIYETKEQTAFNESGEGAWGAIKQYIPGISNRAGNAWGSLIGQSGFMAGTAAYVALETAALTALIPETLGASGGVIVAKSASNVNKVFKSFMHILSSKKRLTTITNAAKKGHSAAKILNSAPVQVTRMFMATLGEGSIEANINAIEFRNDQVKKYQELNGKSPDEAFLADIEKNAVKVGNTTMAWNIPVLMASNFFTIGNLFKPSNRIVSQMVKSGVKKASPFLSSKLALKNMFKGSPKLLKAIDYSAKTGSFLTKGKVAEGVEEVMQGVGSAAASHQYDLFDSDYAEGVGAFLSIAGEEMSTTMNTRKGWDEFVSGYLTGFGMSVGGTAFNKFSGRTAKVNKEVAAQTQSLGTAHENLIKAYTTKQEDLVSPMKGNNKDLLIQGAVAVGMQENSDDGNIRESKDLRLDAKTSLFGRLSKIGVANEYFNMLGNVMNEMKDTDRPAFDAMTEGKSVESVVAALQAEYNANEASVTAIRKNVKNNYKEGTIEYTIREEAIRYAASLELKSADAIKRVEAIHEDLVNKHKVDEDIMMALLEPTELSSKVDILAETVALQRESLNSAEGNQRKIQETELKRNEEKLSLLQSLEVAANKEGVSTQDKVASVLTAFFGDKNLVSSEVQKSLVDILELDNDNSMYTTLYNMLSNDEYFEKYAKTFMGTMLSREKGLFDKKEANSAQPPSESTAEKTKEEFEKDLDDVGDDFPDKGKVMQFISDFEEIVLSEVDVNEDGSLKYKGKAYANAAELLEFLLNENKVVKDAIESKGLRDSLTERVNALINAEKNESEVLEKEEPKPAVKTKEYVKKRALKTKEVGEKEKITFKSHGLKQTMLHYFDLVLANIGDKGSLNRIRKTLKISDTEETNKTLVKLEDADKYLHGNTTLTMLFLGDENTIYRKEGSKKAVKDSGDIRIVTDGIRFYILTAEGTNAKEVIEGYLGLTIEQSGTATVVKDENGKALSSPFREGVFNDASDNAINTLETGQSVSLRVAENKYNKDLEEQRQKGKISEKDFVDRLTIEATVLDENGNEVVVGIMRATDFLFEGDGAKKDKIEKYRADLEGASLGEHIGNVTYTASVVARGKKLVEGKIEYTKVGEYNPENYSTEFFFVTDQGLLNEKGELLTEKQIEGLDSKDFTLGAVYMRISGKNGSKKHTTVQLYGETNNKDFLSGKFKETLETDLSEDNPIVSKRIIVDLGDITDPSDDSTKAEQVEEKTEVLALNAGPRPNEAEEDVKNLKSVLERTKKEKADELEAKKKDLKKKVGAGEKTVEDEINEKHDPAIKALEDQLPEVIEEFKMPVKKVLSVKARRQKLNSHSPQSVRQSVLSFFLNGGRVLTSALQDELGLIIRDRRGQGQIRSVEQTIKRGLHSTKGRTIEQIIEGIIGDNTTEYNNKDIDELLIRNEILDVLSSYNNIPDMVEALAAEVEMSEQESQYTAEDIIAMEAIYEDGLQEEREQFKEITEEDRVAKEAIDAQQQLEQSEETTEEYNALSREEKDQYNFIRDNLKNKDGSISLDKLESFAREEFEGISENVMALIIEKYVVKKNTKATVTDTSGMTVVVENPKVEGNKLVHEDGEIDVTDISEVEVYEGETTTETEKQAEWNNDISGLSKKEIYSWLLKNGVVGETYITAEGITLKILHVDQHTVVTRQSKGPNIIDVAYSFRGEFKTIISAEGKEVQMLEYTESLGPSTKEEVVFKMIETLERLLHLHGFTAFDMESLQKAYQASVIAGEAITDLYDLMVAAGFSQEKIDVMEYTLTSATHQNFWEYITQSEVFYKDKVLMSYNEMREAMVEPVLALQQATPESSPPDKYESFVERQWEKIKAAMASKGFGINLENPMNLTSIDRQALWDTLVDAFSIEEAKESAKALIAGLATLGLKLEGHILGSMEKVSRKSLGKNPSHSKTLNSILEDISEFNSNNKIRNEEDGLFVDAYKDSKKKASDKVISMQQLFNSLGLRVNLNYLKAYEKLNDGNFDSLKNRLFILKSKREGLGSETETLTEENVEKKTNKTITSKVENSVVVYNDKPYYYLLTNTSGEHTYVLEGKVLNVKELNKLFSTAKKPSQNTKRSLLGGRANKVRGLAKKIIALTCT